MIKKHLLLLLLLSGIVMLSGCRGYLTEKSPIHPNPNMDWQAKYKAQKLSQDLPEATVVWGRQSVDAQAQSRDKFLKPTTAFYTGKQNNSWVKNAPVKVSMATLNRGQERYNIYCAACHTQTGDGTKSQITKRGWVITNLLTDVTYNRPDGELFNFISKGVRTMPGYEKVISEEDRWAIVAYLRALQLTQRGRIQDVPHEKRAKLK